MSVIDVLKKLPAAFDANAAGSSACVIQFNASTPAYVQIKDGVCSTVEGKAPAADLTVSMADEDLIALLKGELNGMSAFMTGKLQVEGDLMLAQRMGSFFDAAKLA
ncbi:Putative sterol carrier protein [Solimonas aquatica]|uniref:Putative sterol carrier protein n=1 Tax=Solimonas aquatica TaxID=489703 RepID=A0A1H8ZRG5_9GAMM|nr:SCP2 sterol-binding domain-containing protein [Solimonas aquatica]SEP66965.1 Putative sterol carrier protein [Solimonas aquatica]